MQDPIHCPRCGKKDTWRADNLSRPFCSPSCQLIDLGKWADESYRLSDDKEKSTIVDEEFSS